MKIFFTIITFLLSLSYTSAQTTKLVGMTAYTNNGGIFSVNEDGTNPEQWVNFQGDNGRDPNGSLVENNGKLWGMTIGGGINDKGVIFSLNMDGSNYTKVHDFDGINGGKPRGDLVESNGKFWGMAEQGGANGNGVIFSMNLDGTNYTKVLDFMSLTTGGIPRGNLVESNGKLWGMTEHGGSNLNGVLFSIDLDGTNYTKFHDFHYLTGSYPSGSLVESSGKLWGMTYEGGFNGDGVIFSLDMDGTNYTIVHNFDETNGGFPSGGSLIVSNGKLWGMTQQGGLTKDGVIFSLDINTNNYSKVHDFDDINGKNPRGSLMVNNSKIWGMTQYGGSNDKGVIFSLDLDGTNYKKIYDFDTNTIDGNASGSLIAITTTNITDILDTNDYSSSINVLPYPNPTNGRFRLITDQVDVQIKIYTLTGILIKQFEKNQSYYNISELPNSIYKLVLINDTKIFSGKIIKE